MCQAHFNDVFNARDIVHLKAIMTLITTVITATDKFIVVKLFEKGKNVNFSYSFMNIPDILRLPGLQFLIDDITNVLANYNDDLKFVIINKKGGTVIIHDKDSKDIPKCVVNFYKDLVCGYSGCGEMAVKTKCGCDCNNLCKTKHERSVKKNRVRRVN